MSEELKCVDVILAINAETQARIDVLLNQLNQMSILQPAELS